MVQADPTEEVAMRQLGASGSALRACHGVTVIGVKRPDADFACATPDTVLNTLATC